MASYFSGMMVRGMLTLTPVVCICGGIVVSDLLSTYWMWGRLLSSRHPGSEQERKVSGDTEVSAGTIWSHIDGVGIYHLASKVVMKLSFAYYLALFVQHSIYVTSMAYSWFSHRHLLLWVAQILLSKLKSSGRHPWLWWQNLWVCGGKLKVFIREVELRLLGSAI